MYINSVNRSKLKVYHSGFATLTAILFQPERHSFPTCQAISHLQAGEEDQVPAVIAEVRDTSIHCTVRRNIGLTAPGHGPQTQLRQGSSASGQHKHDRTEWDIHVRSRAFWFWCWAAHSTSLNNARFGSHTQLHCRNLPDIHVHCSPLKFSISGASVNQECKTAGWFNCSQSQMKLAAFGGWCPDWTNRCSFIWGLQSVDLYPASLPVWCCHLPQSPSPNKYTTPSRWAVELFVLWSNIQTTPRAVCLLWDRYSLARQSPTPTKSVEKSWNANQHRFLFTRIVDV